MQHFKSQYSVSRYFTPPHVEPLGLDLARLDGGGYAPAQFVGETHDGREVYVRYRGGQFSVHVANGPGQDALGGGTCLVDTKIGPPLHGGMSIEQVCNYFGITINGTCPPMSMPEQMLYRSCPDLSGATTFYDAWLSSTFDAQKRFLAAALTVLPAVTLLEPVLDGFTVKGLRVCPSMENLASDHSYIVLGGPLTAQAVASLPPDWPAGYDLAGGTVIRLRTCGFQYPVRKYGNDDAGRVHRTTGKIISVAGQVDDCAYGSFSLHAQFRGDDAERRAHVEQVDRLLDEFFPAYAVAYFDLLTGERERDDGFVMHFDPNVVNWVDARPDRWLHVLNKNDWQDPRFVGARAIRVSKDAAA